MLKTLFVTTLAFSPDLRRVALVQKNRPAWLAGKWTAIGGSFEVGDYDTVSAARRELREEAGIDVEVIMPFARCVRKSLGPSAECIFFAAIAPQVDFAQTKTDERVMVWNVSTMQAFQSDFSDDLCALVEMAKMKLKGSKLFFNMEEL